MLFIEATIPTAVRRPTPLRPAKSNEPPGVVNTRSHRTMASRISRKMKTSVSRCSARYRTMPRSMNGLRSLLVRRVRTRPAGGSPRRVPLVTHETKYESTAEIERRLPRGFTSYLARSWEHSMTNRISTFYPSIVRTSHVPRRPPVDLWTVDMLHTSRFPVNPPSPRRFGSSRSRSEANWDTSVSDLLVWRGNDCAHLDWNEFVAKDHQGKEKTRLVVRSSSHFIVHVNHRQSELLHFAVRRPRLVAGHLLLKNGLQIVGVDQLQLFFVRIVDRTDANNGGEPSGEFMSAEGVRGIHTAHDLDVLQIDKLKIVIVEAIVSENLHRREWEREHRYVGLTCWRNSINWLVPHLSSLGRLMSFT